MMQGNVEIESPGFDDLLSPGALFAEKYRILSVLGQGGMGVVYKAEHLLMERVVALKTVLTAFAVNSSAAERFKQEAKAASSLSHPNIVAVHDFGVTNNCAYLVMDYLEGSTLGGEILPFDRFLHIFKQACDALEHAHQHGIIHRDLKCGNLMLVRQDKDTDFLKLVDFGLAKIISPEAGSEKQNLTTTGMIVGSPLYMSPEQCRSRELDARSDIYSLGCVMYEALSGQPPLMGETALDTMCLHLTEMPQSLLKINPDIDARLDRLVMKMLSKEPARRPDSMASVRRELNITAQPPVRHIVAGGSAVKPAGKAVAPPKAGAAKGRADRSRFAGQSSPGDIGAQLWQSVFLSFLLIGTGVIGAMAFLRPSNGMDRAAKASPVATAPVVSDSTSVRLEPGPSATSRALPASKSTKAPPVPAFKPVQSVKSAALPSATNVAPGRSFTNKIDPYAAYDLPRPQAAASAPATLVSPLDFASAEQAAADSSASQHPLRVARKFLNEMAPYAGRRVPEQYSGSRLGPFAAKRQYWRESLLSAVDADAQAGFNGRLQAGGYESASGGMESAAMGRARNAINDAHTGQYAAAKEAYESLRGDLRGNINVFGAKPQLYEELSCIAKHCGHMDEALMLHNRALQLQRQQY